MQIIKLYCILAIFSALGVFLYSRRPVTPVAVPAPSLDSQLNTPVPTADIKAADPQDQQIIIELNQYQDNSLDEDLNNLNQQL